MIIRLMTYGKQDRAENVTAGDTFTVGELLDILDAYDRNTPVIIDDLSQFGARYSGIGGIQQIR